MNALTEDQQGNKEVYDEREEGQESENNIRERGRSRNNGEKFAERAENNRRGKRISQKGGLDGRNDSSNLRLSDSEGRRLSKDTLSKLEGTAVVDEQGCPFSLYHSISKIFDVFEKGDIGFHFGTIEQAESRERGAAEKSKLWRTIVSRDCVLIEIICRKSGLLTQQTISTYIAINHLQIIQFY